jgi:hypothetical protein
MSAPIITKLLRSIDRTLSEKASTKAWNSLSSFVLLDSRKY